MLCHHIHFQSGNKVQSSNHLRVENGYLDNNNCAPIFFEVIVWNRRWLFWTEVFFWGSAAPEEKYRGPKQLPTNSHNDRNKDGAKLLLSLITAPLTISCVLCVFFLTKTRRKQHFLSFLYSIPVNEFRSVQTWRSLRDVISARMWGALHAIVCALTREWRSR